jgi:hypothetical protein
VTYALLIYRSRPATEPIPREDERMALDGHRALQADASSRGQLHAVAQLSDPRQAHFVKRKGGAHEITDGPYIETKEWLVGFYVIDCSDEAEALARARQICPDPSHAVEVRPVTWRWNP